MRPTVSIKTSDFLGLDDATPASIGDQSSSTLQNAYKRRRGIRRRAGTSPVAAALSPDTDLKTLQWVKLGTTEHLISVHNTNVEDWFATPAGSVVGNGTGKFPASGSLDVNGAWVESKLYLGNGVDENQRYNGDPIVAAATFSTAANTNYLYVTNTGTGIFTGQDLTVCAWVYLTAKTGGATFDKVATGTWDRTTMAGRDWFIGYNIGTDRLRFAVQNAGTVSTVDWGSSPTLNTWYFVVGQHDAATNQISIRVNAGAPVTAPHAAGLQEPTTPLRVGGEFLSPTTIDEQWSGRVGPWGIWRTAEAGGGVLSDAIVDSMYNSGVALRFADLTLTQQTSLDAYWDMDETTGTRDDDSTASTTFDLLAQGSIASADGNALARAVAQAMVDPPPDGFTILSHVGGIHALAGDYSYLVSFLNADGEPSATNPSPATVTHGSGPALDISLQNLPLPAAGHDITGRAIWRRVPGSADFILVHTIPDIVTTVWVDDVADDFEGTVLQQADVKFPPCQYLVEHASRLIGAGNAASPQTLFVSDKFKPWYCPESPDINDPNQGTRANVQGRSAGAITGLCSHGSYVAVMTYSEGWFLSGDEPLDDALTRFSSHGCVSHRSMVSAKGLLIWLGPEAVFAFDGTHTFRASDDVRTTVEALTPAEKASANAFVWQDRYFLCWSTGCLVLDLEYAFPHVWSTNTAWLWGCSTVAESVTGTGQRLYAGQVGHARAWQLETGSDDAGMAIPMRWASRDYDMGLMSHEKRVHFIETRWTKGTGTATILLKKGSGQTIQTITYDISTVDDVSETVSRQFTGAVEQARSEFFRIDVSISSTAAVCELLAAQAEWTPCT